MGNLKNKGLFVVLLLILFFSTNLFLISSENHDITIDEVLKEIRAELRLDNNEKIDPDKTPDHLLEKLGDAVMSNIHPDEKTHQWMDKMMGGEGSQSLTSMHIRMGYNYLNGYIVNKLWGGMPMMMGFGGMMSNNHMNDYWRFGFGIGGIIMGIILLIFIAGIIVLVLFLVKKGTLNNGSIKESPLDILKKRLAKGEITKDEFDKIKKDLL